MSHKNLKGRLSIARPRGNGPDYVQIDLTDESSGTRAATIRLSLENFTETTVGNMLIECEFDYYPERVGKVREWKDENVSIADLPFYVKNGEERQRLARETLKPYETDGWRGDVDDLFNHHRRSGKIARVGFVRYVEHPATSTDGEG